MKRTRILLFHFALDVMSKIMLIELETFAIHFMCFDLNMFANSHVETCELALLFIKMAHQLSNFFLIHTLHTSSKNLGLGDVVGV